MQSGTLVDYNWAVGSLNLIGAVDRFNRTDGNNVLLRVATPHGIREAYLRFIGRGSNAREYLVLEIVTGLDECRFVVALLTRSTWNKPMYQSRVAIVSNATLQGDKLYAAIVSDLHDSVMAEAMAASVD